MKTLQEILERKAALKQEVATRSAEMSLEDIQKINAELNELEAAEKEIRAKQDLDKRMAEMVIPTQKKEEKQGELTPEQAAFNERAKRGALYKMRSGVEIEVRAASTVKGTSASGVLIPSHLDPTVDAYPWNEVSSIVDLANVVSLPNGSEYTKSFQVETGEGAYTLEATKTGLGTTDNDGLYHEVDTTFDQVTIKRNKITALTYMSEELVVLPEANYADLVERNVSLSLKKKLAKEMVLGDGTGNHFVGIACTTTSNMNANTYTDAEYGIDENTLFNMMIDFGGEEDVEARQVLVMNKLTLKEFAKVRGNDKKPVYSITVSGNTFTIDGYRGVFSKNIKPYSTATAGDIWAVYADMAKYDLLNFGGEAIETSREFKFNQGVTTVRGKVYAGGGMAGYKAFLRAKKPAA